MSYTIIIDKDTDDDNDRHNDSASDLSGWTPAHGSDNGDDERYLSDGVAKLRDLVDSGYISDGEERRRKELIEQFIVYQNDLRDYDDDDEGISLRAIFFQLFNRCWRGFGFNMTRAGSR